MFDIQGPKAPKQTYALECQKQSFLLFHTTGTTNKDTFSLSILFVIVVNNVVVVFLLLYLGQQQTKGCEGANL
jgi:hypothetical protein